MREEREKKKKRGGGEGDINRYPLVLGCGVASNSILAQSLGCVDRTNEQQLKKKKNFSAVEL